jgi:exodeoxyribonuclease-5
MPITLTAEQQAIAYDIEQFARKSPRQTFVLHGLAGTGKTTLLSSVASLFPNAMLCTLTGKAASVLRRKTGLDVHTVHSAFYKLVGEELKDKKKNLIFRNAHFENALKDRILFLDECSMINEKIASDLLSSGVKIVACGDPGQLPPVEGESFFNKPDAMLKTIHRQALDSPIIRQAHRVRLGEKYETDGDNFVVRGFGEVSNEEKTSADMILCWTNKTRRAVNNHIRQLRGFEFAPMPLEQETILCLKNAPDFGIFNGGLYTLLEPFTEGDTEITIEVEGRTVVVPNVNFHGLKSGLPEGVKATTWFDFGYALTVHKAQGSEWQKVILIDEYRRREERSQWLYTGITRASDKIIIVR